MTLHRIFIRSAKRWGSKPCVLDRSTGRDVTYERALIASLILMSKFSDYEKGFLGLMLPTSAGCLLSSVATLMSGRTPVMINYSGDARGNALYAQKKCDFTTIITSRALLEKINCQAVEGMVFIEDIMNSISSVDKIRAAVTAKLPIPALERFIHKGKKHDDAVILFTSGSEKDPKAVELTHRNIISNVETLSRRYELTSEDIFLANLPYFHVFGLTANLWAPLYHGMTIVSYASPIEYRRICEIIRDDKPTLIVGTPSFFWGYLRRSEPGDFQSARIMLAGADKCPEALRKAFLEKHGKVLYEAYGATETSPGLCGNSPGMNRPGSVGTPFEGVEVTIEHHVTGEPCAVGEHGRILVRGECVMKGYFDDFEETAMHIRHGWYDTGDMGYLDEDGYLWHVGRFRRFVKIGGEMISLVKVENALEELLPEGMECCVVEIPDAVKGSRIIAALTGEIDQKAVQKKLSARLANIELPKQFVTLAEFPKMGSGKIDFRATTEIVREMLHRH